MLGSARGPPAWCSFAPPKPPCCLAVLRRRFLAEVLSGLNPAFRCAERALYVASNSYPCMWPPTLINGGVCIEGDQRT